jgi:hypothetical protein
LAEGSDIMDDVKGRVATLESRWRQSDARLEHMDGKVSSLAVDVAALKTGVDSIVKSIDGLSSATNRPTNWLGVGSLIVTLVVVLAQYVDLRLTPIIDEIGQNRSTISILQETLQDRGVVIGNFEAQLVQIRRDLDHYDSLHHEQEKAVVELREKAAAAEVSRKAMGDYLRQVDELGSRKWVNGDPKHASRVED